MKKITVVGTGFGALTTIRTLRKRDKHAEITVIGKEQEFLYYPSLIWVPSGLRTHKDISVNLTNFFAKHQVNFHPDAAERLEAGGRKVVTENGTVENDALVIATGGRYLQKLPGIEHVTIPCRGYADAEKFRQSLHALKKGTIAFGFSGNPNEGSAMRGGPIFEFLFGTHTLLKKQGRRQDFRLAFFCPSPRPGQRMGDKAVNRLLTCMKDSQIDLHIGHKLKGFTENSVKTEAGEFQADLVAFIPGMTGSAWLQDESLPKSPGGFLRANEQCQVEGLPHVYAVGDCASFPGPDWKPKQAHMADLQAICAANNALAALNGKPANQTFRTELACIVDSTDKGMFVARTRKHNFMLPSLTVLHWLKRFFEWWYLRAYR
ncbi:MAG TPA: pyridine nucleotide-disulfide oxidoreductase [Gammaproteobacteria bacterium]|nr:pyridine nucleotide-disulfide oxidoreductase [Gammaproteobacteria bacterium]